MIFIGNYKKLDFFKGFLVIGLWGIFIMDGTGILEKRVILPVVIIYSLFLYLFSFIEKRKQISSLGENWSSLIILCYLLYLTFITSFSLNRQVSYEYLIFLFSILLLFNVIKSTWKALESTILYNILGLGLFFSFYSLILPFLLRSEDFFYYLFPRTGFQYVYSLYGVNNHLGEFLVFPIVITIALYINRKKKYYLLLLLLYFPFLLLSYSRAGYISLIFALLFISKIYWKVFPELVKRSVIALFILTIGFLCISTFNVLQFTHQTYIGHVFGKSTIEVRKEYLFQALEGFQSYSIFGVGIGNFEFVSKMYGKSPEVFTSTSHNIFLDTLVETGSFGFMFYIAFTVYLFKKIRKNKNLYSILFVSWIVIVQFSYLHRMYSYVLLLPFILVGIENLKQNEHQKIDSFKYINIFISILLLLFLTIYISSHLSLISKNYYLSRQIYPLQMEAYKQEFTKSNKTNLDQKDILVSYMQVFPGDYWGFYQYAKIFEKEDGFNIAIESYERSFWIDPFRDLAMSERVYNLKQIYHGEKEAKEFAEKLFRKLNNDGSELVLGYNHWLFINKFCQRVYSLHCPYTLK